MGVSKNSCAAEFMAYIYKLPNDMLWQKVVDGDANGTRRALAGKADPNSVDVNCRGETAMHKAAEGGCVNVIRMLLQYRADVDPIDRMYSQIPLHRAADNGHTDAVNVLLEHSSDPNKQDRYGETALHKAAKAGHLDAIVALVDGKALVDSKCNSGMSPLIVAAQKGHADAVRLLLASGVSVDNRDITYGWTALHFASSEGHESTIASLIEGGANPNTKDEGGRTAIHCAKTPAIRMLICRLASEYEIRKISNRQ